MPGETNRERSSGIGSGARGVMETAKPATAGRSAPSAPKSKRTTAPLSRNDALEILQTAIQNAQAAGVHIVVNKIRGESLILARIAATQCKVCGIWRLDEDMATAVMCQHCAGAVPALTVAGTAESSR